MDGDIVTRKILEKVGHDTPLTWMEEESGIIFTASQWDMLLALFGINEIICCGNLATLEDFLMGLPNPKPVFPENFDTYVLNAGWSQQCFTCWDGMFIDIWYEEIVGKRKPVIPFYFLVDYCKECVDCPGCDRPYQYDKQSQNKHFL